VRAHHGLRSGGGSHGAVFWFLLFVFVHSFLCSQSTFWQLLQVRIFRTLWMEFLQLHSLHWPTGLLLLSGSDFSFCTPVFALWLFLGFLFCNKGFWSLLKKKKKKKKIPP